MYQIRNAEFEDLADILKIYAYARAFMAKTGNPSQWGRHNPPKEQLEQDILRRKLYVVWDGKGIHGVFFFHIGEDPTYAVIEEGKWGSDRPYGTIHRIASDGSGGILKTATEFCSSLCSHIRIDTHRDNRVMQSALHKLGFTCRGIIHIADGSPRLAYDRIT